MLINIKKKFFCLLCCVFFRLNCNSCIYSVFSCIYAYIQIFFNPTVPGFFKVRLFYITLSI